jgi:hypothetical protein
VTAFLIRCPSEPAPRQFLFAPGNLSFVEQEKAYRFQDFETAFEVLRTIIRFYNNPHRLVLAGTLPRIVVAA